MRRRRSSGTPSSSMREHAHGGAGIAGEVVVGGRQLRRAEVASGDGTRRPWRRAGRFAARGAEVASSAARGTTRGYGSSTSKPALER
jgi:hypothetical protein